MSWKKVLGIGGLVLAMGLTMAIPSSTAASQPAGRTAAPTALGAPPAPGGGPGATPFVPTFQPTSELLYVAVPPCRIADTRKGGGLIGGGSTRTFHVTGTSGFAPAGGTSGGCGIPAGASAAAISVTGTGSTGSGFMTVFAQGGSRPNVSQVSFTRGQNVSTPANAPLNPGSGSVSVYNSATTHVLLDVSGYYVKPLAGFISPSGGTYAGSSRVVSSSRVTDPGVYEVTFDRDVRYCTAVASAYYYNYYASVDSYGTGSVNILRVRIWNSAGSPVNGYFGVTVNC